MSFVIMHIAYFECCSQKPKYLFMRLFSKVILESRVLDPLKLRSQGLEKVDESEFERVCSVCVVLKLMCLSEKNRKLSRDKRSTE